MLRVAERLFNRPLMISETKLQVILGLFGRRAGLDLVGLAAPPPGRETAEVSDQERGRAGYTARNGLGVIGIYGPLMHRVLEMEFPSGGPTTYADIRRAFDLAMVDDEVQGIVLDIDSPGGEANGVFDLADHIRQARGVKPVTAVVNESAFSAAYLLASAADRIVLPRTGGAGSIGVIATHADFSRAEDQAGITVTHVYAGARKADFSPHQPLTPEALTVLQGLVDDTYTMFVDTVARNRGMTAKAVRETEAGIFEGKKAVAAKLADEVASADVALANARRGKGTRIVAASTAQGKEKSTMTLEELRQQHPDLVAQIEAKARQGLIAQADADTAKATAATAERGRVLALVTAAVGEDAGKKIGAAAEKGLTAEDLTALGVSLAPAAAAAGGETERQMLEAIQAAAPQGLKAATGRPGEAESRKAAAAAIAAGGAR